MRRYLLSRHVFACMQGEQAVLLDLRRDQYLALDGESTRHLGEVVIEWPATAPATGDTPRALDATIQQLLNRDLLTIDPRYGKPGAPVSIPLPMRTLLPPVEILARSTQTRERLTPPRIAALLGAAIRAKLWLRLRGIEWIVDTLTRKAIRSAPREPLAAELVSLFFDSRPFLFSARNACLFDSLALLLFLRRFGVCPDWIFGVRAGPFAAHCWLQSGSVVLNDSVENVRSYTPIMVV
jgi:hypothetical protein